MTKSIIAALVALAPAFVGAAASADGSTSGQWSVARTAAPSRVQLELRSTDRANGYSHWDSSNDVELAKFPLSAAALDSPGQHVQFTIARDAGSFVCDGWAGHGTASGTFTFTANQAFLDGMQKRGYGDTIGKKILTAASVDLTLPYVDAIGSAGYPHLKLEQLITFRALDVTPQSIGGFRSTFGNDLSAEEITSLTALRVTPAYVAELRGLGISAPSARQAVELKALGIDRTYVDDLAKAGYTKLDPHQLVELKALGVDGTYIRHLSDHGLKNLSASQLVQMKAAGL